MKLMWSFLVFLNLVYLWILVLRQNLELRDENADLKAKLDEVTKDKNNAEERIHLLEAER